MLLTSLMPFRRRQRGWRKGQRTGARRPSRVAAVERLEARTLLSAVTYRTEVPTDIEADGTAITLDVDIDVSIADLQADLVLAQLAGEIDYIVNVIAPNNSRTRLESTPPDDDGNDDDGNITLRFDQLDDLAELTGSTLGRWTFEVTVMPRASGMGMPMPLPDDLGLIVSGDLLITPELPSPDGTISGVVFEDFDGDGVRDDSEPGRGFVDLDDDRMLNGAEQPFTVYVDLNGNGMFDSTGTNPEPSDQVDDETGAYEITGLPTPQSYAVGLVSGDGSQTSIFGSDIPDATNETARFTFATNSDSGGFRTEGLPLGPTTTALPRWQLTDDQRFAANHSHDFSAVFAAVMANGDVVAPDPGTRGVLLSPQVVLPSTDAPLELQFQSFVRITGNGEIESLVDSLQVSAVLPDGRTIRLTGPEFGIDSTRGFTFQSIDISALAAPSGRPPTAVQFEFLVEVPLATESDDDESDNNIELQGWYLDDIAIVQLDVPGTQIVHLNAGQHFEPADFAVASGNRSVSGTVFSDLNGDGERTDDEPGLPGQIIVYDRDNNGFDGQVRVFESRVEGDSEESPDLSVEIGDDVTGTLLGVELVGQLNLTDPEVFEALDGLELGLTLASPVGQFQALSGVIAPPDYLFESGEPPFPATLNMLLPESTVSLLRTQPVNGTWQLVGAGELGRFLREALKAEIDSLALRLTVVQESDDPASDRFVIADDNGDWQFNGLRPDDPPRFDLMLNPLTASETTRSTVTFQSMLADDGLVDGSLENFNFGVFFADTHANTALGPDPSDDERPLEDRVVPVDLDFGDTGILAGIDFVTDHDVFRVPSGTDGLITLAVDTGQGSLNPVDTQLTVFTLDMADGQLQRTEVAFNDNSLFFLNGDFDARVQFQADSTRQYFVEVSGSDTGDPFPNTPRQTTGTYELLASLEPRVVESEDSMLASDVFDADLDSLIPDDAERDQEFHAIGVVDFAGDRDIYRIEAPRPGVLQVDVEDLNSGVTAELSVFFVRENEDGSSVVEQLKPAPGEINLPEPETDLLALPTFVQEVSRGDVFFVQVSAATTEDSPRFGASTGQYLLSTSVVNENDDRTPEVSRDDPRDSRLLIDQVGEIDFVSDIDRFELTVPDQNTRTVAGVPVTNPVTDGFLEILLQPGQVSLLEGHFAVHRAATGERIVDSTAFNSSAFLTLEIGNDRPLAPGEELLVFVDGSEATRGGYRLTSRYIPRDRTGRPAGESPGPGPLAISPAASVEATIDFAGDVDEFQFTVPPANDGSTLVLATVDVQRLNSERLPIDSRDIVIKVRPSPNPNDDGPAPVRPENESGVNNEFLFVATPGVSYQPDVALTGLESGNYRISVSFDDVGAADEFPDNLVFPIPEDAEGQRIVPGALQKPGDHDVFSFTAETSGLLNVELELGRLAGDAIVPEDRFTLAITDRTAGTAVDAQITKENRGAEDDESGRMRALETDFEVVAGRTYVFDISSSNSAASYELEVNQIGTIVESNELIQLDLDQPVVVESAIQLSGGQTDVRLSPQGSGELDIEFEAIGRDSLAARIDVIETGRMDASGNALPDRSIASKDAQQKRDDLEFRINAVAGQELVIRVQSLRSTTGEFALGLFLSGDEIDDDFADDASLTDPNDDIELQPGEIDGAFVLDEPILGRIDFDTDFDVLAIVAPVTGQIRVAVNAIGDNNLLDPDVAVAGPQSAASRTDVVVDFENPLQFDDNSGTGLNAELEFSAVAGLVYFIEVAAANAEEGDYEVIVSAVPDAQSDDFGDSFNAASELLLNGSGNLSRDRNGDGRVTGVSETNRSVYGFLDADELTLDDDTDFFRFTSTVSGQLQVSARPISLRGDAAESALVTELFVFGESQDQRPLLEFGAEELILDAVSGATYFLRIDSRAFGSGLYEIGIQPVSTTRDFRLPEIEEGQQAAGLASGRITLGGQADLYELAVPFSGRLVVELNADNSNNAASDTVLSVFDESGTAVAANDDDLVAGTTNSRVEFNVQTNDVFVLRAGFVGDNIGRYQLTARLLPDTAIGNDPGESIRDASDLAFSTGTGVRTATETVTLSSVTRDEPGFDPDPETDVYSFLADTTGEVSVTLVESSSLDADVRIVRELPNGDELVVANGTVTDGTTGPLTFQIVTGETYAVRISGSGSGVLRSVLTPRPDTRRLPFLSDAVGNATVDLLNQIFIDLVSSGADFRGEDLAQAVLTEFFEAQGGQEKLQDRFLLLYVDPVDFVLESESTGSQAGFTRDQGQLDQYGNTFYSGDAVTELLVIPQADSGRYTLQLEGLGSNVRGGASLVSNAGVTSQTFEFDNLSGQRILALDFPETERPSQVVTADDIEGPVPDFPTSVLLAALLGVNQQPEQVLVRGPNYRDFSVFSIADLPGWEDLPRIIGNLFDDLRAVLPVDDLFDAEPDGLLPAIAPGMNGLTEAMSRFGEIFGELLLPVTEADDNADPADDAPDDSERGDKAPRGNQPAVPAPVPEAPPVDGDEADAQASAPSGTTERTNGAEAQAPTSA